MNTKIVSFRCPEELLRLVDQLSGHYNQSRNAVVVAALNLFSRQIREQGGSVVPPPAEDQLTREALFPKPGRAPRTPKK